MTTLLPRRLAIGLLLAFTAPSAISLSDVTMQAQGIAPDCMRSDEEPLRVWDYGDAPDSTKVPMTTFYQFFPPAPPPNGQFPTLSTTAFSLYGTPGARHQIVDVAWLGADSLYPLAPNPAPLVAGDVPPSREADADAWPDPDPTTNFKNGNLADWDVGDDGLRPTILGAGVSLLPFRVSTTSGIQDWYVNILVDWTYDGKWKGLDPNGAPEWAVQDFPVSVPPMSSQWFAAPVAVGSTLYEPWVRITLSDTPVGAGILAPLWPDGWDGSTPPGTLDFNGDVAFACGETEDYCGRVQIQFVTLGTRVLCPHDHA